MPRSVRGIRASDLERRVVNWGAISESPKKAVLVLGAMRFIKTALALASMIISARLFGVSLERDYLVICIAAMTVIPQFLFGPINEIFRLKYAHLQVDEGTDSAVRRGTAVMSVSFWILVAVTLAIEIHPQMIVNSFAPAYSGSAHAEIVDMVRIVVPLLVLNQIAAGWTHILNAHKVYFLPEIVGIITSGLGVILVITLSRWIGIYSLVVSMYVSAAALLLAMIPTLYSASPSALAVWKCDPRLILPFLTMAAPFFVGSTLGQILVVIEKRFSGAMGEGMISIYDYAQKINMIPLAVIITSIASVLAPSLATLHAQKNIREFRKEFAGYIRLALVAICLVFIAFTIGAKDMLEIVFSTKLSATERDVMASTLGYFACGLVAATVYSLSGQAITASLRGRLFAVVGGVVQLAVILLNLWLARRQGVQMLALSWALAHAGGAAVLLLIVGLNKDLLKALGHAVCVYAGTCLGVLVVLALPDRPMHPVVHFSLLMIAASIGLGISLFAFCLPEREFLSRAASKLHESIFRRHTERTP